MRPNTKGVHLWRDGKGIELEPGVMPAANTGSICACWNDLTGKWEFGIYGGFMWVTIKYDTLPGGFKAYLLIVGVS